jgi:hypothetical protein
MKIENLNHFLHEVGAETPYRAGRILYKYTGCGPWTTYLVEKSPARTAFANFRISIQNKKLTATYTEDWEPGDSQLVKDGLSFLGFDPCEPKWWIGKSRKWRSISSYHKRLRDFMKQIGGVGERHRELRIEDHSRRHMDVLLTRHIPAEIEDVYYISDRANRPLENCVGITVGSIVEGSDVEIDPVSLHFPFESEEFWKVVRAINDEASFYWKRDNLNYYQVTYRGREYPIESGWWSDLKLPKSIKQIVQDYINKNTIADDNEVTIPNTKIKIIKYDSSDWIY